MHPGLNPVALSRIEVLDTVKTHKIILSEMVGDERVEAASTPHDVDIAIISGIEVIVAVAAMHDVGTASAKQRVVISTARHNVIATSTAQVIPS